MKKFVSYALIALFVLITIGVKPGNVYGFKFDKDYLINDKVFVDYTSMNERDIEQFLQDNGSILAEYRQDGIPASKIIFDAAQKYRINPKVILTTLQKEEALITLRAYSSYAINFAMGFHKPSNFKSQVYEGTKLLRDGYDFLAEKYGWKVGVPHRTEDNPKYINNIVIPENRATASLYLYTPYIGGYYMSNGDYIGGNYNFVKIFNRWFGDPTKYISFSLFPEKVTFYVPYGESLKFPVIVKNTGNTDLNFRNYTLIIQDMRSGDVLKKMFFNFNLGVKVKKKIYITLDRISKMAEIKVFVVNKNGRLIGNNAEIMIVPVDFTVSYKKFSENLILKIDTKRNVPCAYLTASFINGDSGDEICKENILNNSLFSGSLEKTVNIPKGYKNLILRLAFAGADSDCGVMPVPIVFFDSPINPNNELFNIRIDTVPQGASVFIDEKFMGKSPLSLMLKRNIYTITLRNAKKTVKTELELFSCMSLKFILTGKSSLPPLIKITKLPLITNHKTISIEGEVTSDSKISELFGNGKKLKIDSYGKFSYGVNLNEGKNDIILSATDIYGNSETIYSEVVLDTVPPRIITNKIPDITPNMFLKLNINVENGSKLFVNGKQCEFLNCAVYLTLKKGENKIEIEAVDEAGNKAVKVVKVIYLPPNPTVLKLYIGKDFFYINGIKRNMDTPPIITDDRTMLPVRHIVEALDGKIFYYAESKTVEIRINGGDVVLAIGKNTAIVNGKKQYIDAENKNIRPFIKNGRTYLPLRFIMESIGSSVEWIPDERAIVIIYPKIT